MSRLDRDAIADAFEVPREMVEGTPVDVIRAEVDEAARRHPDHVSEHCYRCLLVTGPSRMERFADWLDRDPLVVVGWAVVVLACVWFLVVPAIS